MNVEHLESGDRLTLDSASELATLRSATVIYLGDLPRNIAGRREVKNHLLDIASRASIACAELTRDPAAESFELSVSETRLCVDALSWTVDHPKRFLTDESKNHLVEMYVRTSAVH